MGVTSYYSLDGEIIAEQTGAIRTEYSRDALGSVTATRNLNTDKDAYNNTYRYKPYGARLAKTGTDPDPDFQYVGIAGYRHTGLAHSGSYVRRRHYAEEEGRWTTVDALWPWELGYGYVDNEPVRQVDASGLAPNRKLMGSAPCECGLAELGWGFTVDKGSNGWLIQRIERTFKGQKCDGKKLQSCTPTWGSPFVYFEAWKVVGGKVLLPRPDGGWEYVPPQDYPTDLWSNGSGGQCTHGSLSIKGQLMFLKGSLPTQFRRNTVKCAGMLPATSKHFTGWKSQGGAGSMTVQWGCCKLRKDCPPPKKEKCPTEKCEEGPCIDCSFDYSPRS